MVFVESDAQLVLRVQGGDQATFERLIVRYERSVRSVALAFLADHHAAEDATQEAFVAAYRSLLTLREPDKFGPWLMQITRRVSGEMVGQRERMPVMVAGHERVAAAVGFDLPLRQHLLALLEQLPEQERLVVTLRYFDGHSAQEIADITARPLGTVTKQLSRAYEHLRELFAQSEKVDQ